MSLSELARFIDVRDSLLGCPSIVSRYFASLDLDFDPELFVALLLLSKLLPLLLEKSLAKQPQRQFDFLGVSVTSSTSNCGIEVSVEL
jgi:hypothetical protein